MAYSIYFENFREVDKEGNGIGQSSYAELIGHLIIEPDEQMWKALQEWAKREGFTDVTDSEMFDELVILAEEQRYRIDEIQEINRKFLPKEGALGKNFLEVLKKEVKELNRRIKEVYQLP